MALFKPDNIDLQQESAQRRWRERWCMADQPESSHFLTWATITTFVPGRKSSARRIRPFIPEDCLFQPACSTSGCPGLPANLSAIGISRTDPLSEFRRAIQLSHQGHIPDVEACESVSDQCCEGRGCLGLRMKGDSHRASASMSGIVTSTTMSLVFPPDIDPLSWRPCP